MRAGPETDILSDIARLQVSIDRVATVVDVTLADQPVGLQDVETGLAERQELRRQLAALRERVAQAGSQHQDDPRALRAELATLLFFAKTLGADAGSWRAGLDDRFKVFERQKTATRQEQERLAAERQELIRRRDALQCAIDQTAKGMAQRDGGEARRTLPVLTLGEGVTVCSVGVSIPRKGIRSAKRWIVTLNDSLDQVLVKSG